jgi:hypothetical protein
MHDRAFKTASVVLQASLATFGVLSWLRLGKATPAEMLGCGYATFLASCVLTTKELEDSELTISFRVDEHRDLAKTFNSGLYLMGAGALAVVGCAWLFKR